MWDEDGERRREGRDSEVRENEGGRGRSKEINVSKESDPTHIKEVKTQQSQWHTKTATDYKGREGRGLHQGAIVYRQGLQRHNTMSRAKSRALPQAKAGLLVQT